MRRSECNIFNCIEFLAIVLRAFYIAGTYVFMKNTLLKITAVWFSFSFSFSALAADVVVYCDHEFKNEIVEINSDSDVDACVADLIWGKKNVCFEGDANALAEMMNDEKFKWLSSGYSAVEASVSSEGAVNYTGVDAKSFYMAKRTVFPCAPEFFNK